MREDGSKNLTIPFLPDVQFGSPVDKVMAGLAAAAMTTLDEVPWKTYPYKPMVVVKMAHTCDSLILNFSVEEKHLKAEYRNTNDPVYRDSCVEFFISFDGVNYYNLEFNCIGTGFIGYGGPDKSRRNPLRKSLVEQVRTHAVINSNADRHGGISWRLLINVPFSVFEADSIEALSGTSCTANFYKCGDDLPDPHYIAWNTIDHPTPNFHLPRFFGRLFFV